jgi:uncharacterized protein YjiS (DUF1127 family)
MRLLSISLPAWLVAFGAKRRWTQVLLVVVARRKGRKALAVLDDHMLDDIGITRAMATAETEKPFWRD